PDWVKPVKGSAGRVVDTRELVASLVSALESPTVKGSGVRFTAPMQTVPPKLGLKGIARRYPTVITVSRSGYRLYLFKHLKLARTFPVAVGRAGLETPAGLYAVQEKQTNPSWHVPNSPWAGKLAGKVIPPGPDDPIKARWMGLAAGVGIHGTADESSLGSAASHGCIRMAPVDVIWLYDRVPMGTPVYVS
ncbi:MAG: L,D-transpeptidase, partial [Actinomycetes bacterium]